MKASAKKAARAIKQLFRRKDQDHELHEQVVCDLTFCNVKRRRTEANCSKSSARRKSLTQKNPRGSLTTKKSPFKVNPVVTEGVVTEFVKVC